MTLANQLQQLVDDPLRPISGVAAGLWVNGQVIAQAQAGWQQMGQAHPNGSVALGADSLFRIASVSKLAVAIIQMRLHEAGILKLDDDVHAIARHPQHGNTAITPRLLLTHRSGLRDSGDLIDPNAQGLRKALADARHWAAQPPGEHFAYCNLGFIVLATAMERACGKRFDAIAQEWLFEPLGMQARFHPHLLSPAALARLATLYRRPQGQWTPQVDGLAALSPPPAPPQLEPGVNAACFSPQGGLRTGIADMLHMGALLAQSEQHSAGQPLISQTGLREMLRTHWSWQPGSPDGNEDGLFRAWALGLQRFTDQGDGKKGDRLSASGGWQGFGHLGQAYGLFSGLIFNPAEAGRPPWALAYAITGHGVPESQAPGRHSSFTLWEEQILQPLLETLQPALQGRH